MYKTVVAYTSDSGEEKTETVYFHLSKMDRMDLLMKDNGTYVDKIQELGKTQPEEALGKLSAIWNTIKELVAKAYGERITDANGITAFVKRPELTEKFMQSDCCAGLLLDWLEHPEKVQEFVDGLSSVK